MNVLGQKGAFVLASQFASGTVGCVLMVYYGDSNAIAFALSVAAFVTLCLFFSALLVGDTVGASIMGSSLAMLEMFFSLKNDFMFAAGVFAFFSLFAAMAAVWFLRRCYPGVNGSFWYLVVWALPVVGGLLYLIERFGTTQTKTLRG